MQYSLSPSYKDFETQWEMYHPKNGEKKQVSFILTGMDFGLNPNHTISKKKDHCLRNTYDIKNMQLYHNIVKKQGEEYPSFFEGFSNHNLFLMGLKNSPLFYNYQKK